VGEIGNAKRQVAQSFLDSSQAFLNFPDPVTQPLHGSHGFLGRVLRSAKPRDLVGAFLELVPELFDLGRQRPPFFTQFPDHFPRNIAASRSQRSADLIQILPKLFNLVHDPPLKSAWNLAPASPRVNETDGLAKRSNQRLRS
jgi:hypothetical protein